MVVLGETTHAAVADAFPTEPLGSVQLKGLRRKIDIYRLAVEKIENSGTIV
jgi:class 3 adenylate cyclase